MRRALTVALVGLAATLAGSAGAQTLRLGCERLDPERRDELRARMRLLLRSARRSAPSAVELRCDETTAWLVYEAGFRERIPVDEGNGLVEGALDALEARLARPQPRSPGPLRPRSDTSSWRAPRRDAAEAQELGGGAGLGLGVEPSPFCWGPRVDLGLPVGRLAVVATHSLRRAPGDTLLVVGEAGLALGAPYATRWPVGVVATAGMEALSVASSVGGPAGSRGERWDTTAVASLGLRGALRVDRTALWIGVDGRHRFHALSVDVRGVELARTGVFLSIGALLGLELNP